eukprot:c19721_g1_i2 orf=731-2491(-)
MAIIEHLVEQSTRKLDKIKMNKHKKARQKVEIMENKDAATRLDQQNHSSSSMNPLNPLSDEDHVPSSSGVRDENQEVTSVIASDGFLYPHTAVYPGFSSPFINMPGYTPFFIDGVQCYSPVIDYSLLYQPLYGSFACDSHYSVQGYGYGTQVHQYSPHAYYQQLPNGDYFTTPSAFLAGGVMMLGSQDPAQLGVVMPDELSNLGGQMPGLSTNIVPAPLPDAALSASHCLRASAPAWVESALKQKGLQFDVDSAGVQPGVSEPSSISLSMNKAASSTAVVTTVSNTCVASGTSNTIAFPRAAVLNASSCLDGALKQDSEVATSVNSTACVPTDTWVAKIRGQVAPAFVTCKNSSGNLNKDSGPRLPNREEYNSPSFMIKNNHAKYFIIKSYSEDNVNRSIEYSVWASTPNGNKKLDEAYQDAQRQAIEMSVLCPVFLLFSVNGSRQFCGVAEMTGPLDYSKTMAFWEQHKWSGSFPVKWHIIKNVPNSQFRKIILENNENKPVTNSRDTQEVNLQQGLEMLNIFKSYPARTSILNEFSVIATQQGMQNLQLQHWPPHSFSKISEFSKSVDDVSAIKTKTAKLNSSA